MKNVKIIAAALALIATGSFAQSISVTAATLSDAEAKIAREAQAAGASYQITEAFNDNRVHMTAQLQK
ncbi:DUF1471 domain-containing protein [[Erwinia] mediterraneensis]|uniref:DUF1471 domain-containing protein n=1 Tax=[Erwinia] mediterraneensis TaxID=2161819 RepID=UPI001030E5CB|nr:DUF1471 domain-containing protein [[Erwinia] mediterraneensis]